jgi:hypothetical protein
MVPQRTVRLLGRLGLVAAGWRLGLVAAGWPVGFGRRAGRLASAGGLAGFCHSATV